MTNDDKKWLNSSNQEKQKIARSWAKKYTIKTLRGFQALYEQDMSRSVSNDEYFARKARLDTATLAIDYRAFVMNKTN